MENTRDLLEFGYRELDLAGDLLKAFKNGNDKTQRLDHPVAIEFNPNSGSVFLIDEDFNVAMMNGEYLEDWLYCPECGEEGFLEDFENCENECCKLYIKEIAI